MFKKKYLLIPFATANIRIITEETFFGQKWKGVTDVYIFGIRIARIQRSIPWE